MEPLMYVLFLAVGFGLGVVVSLSIYAKRIERLTTAPAVTVTPPAVQVNVSAELVARYLESFDLVAIPKRLIVSADEAATRH